MRLREIQRDAHLQDHSEEKIQSFLPVLDGMITGGLVTMEKVRALHYRGDAHEE